MEDTQSSPINNLSTGIPETFGGLGDAWGMLYGYVGVLLDCEITLW